MIEIHCLCGATAVEVRGEPAAQFFCHCDECRAVHGGAYVAVSVYPKDAVRVSRGTVASWTLRALPRWRCEECGTRLIAEVEPIGMRAVNGFLLPEGAFNPQFHIQCRFAVRPVRDDLPHYAGLPPVFGGADEQLAW